MKITVLSSVTLGAGLLLLMPGSAKAHHGWVDFDEKTEITVAGTVTAFHFVNPHCVVELDVKNEKGQIQKWQAEFSSKKELSGKGWSAFTLEAGDGLTLTGHPAKDGALAIHVIKIRMSNGEMKVGLEQETR